MWLSIKHILRYLFTKLKLNRQGNKLWYLIQKQHIQLYLVI